MNNKTADAMTKQNRVVLGESLGGSFRLAVRED